MGSGETLMLFHGAGGSTHSFRDLMPLLARRFHVVALDLPGQGLTQLGARHRCGLGPVVEDIAALCERMAWRPAGLVGHSAGGAVALGLAARWGETGSAAPKVVGINAALNNFEGLAGALFPVLAKLLAAVPFTARAFSNASATPERVRALIASTGSSIGPDGLALYRRLIADRDHVDGTLLMMAQWSLDNLEAALPDLVAPTLFLVGDNDKTVPPRVSEKAAARMRLAQVTHLAGAGHLAHEEYPEQVAGMIADWMAGRPAADGRGDSAT